MPLPYPFLTVVIGAGLWYAGHAWSCAHPSTQASAEVPAFAVPGSAFGSLTARVMRDSLHSYWHGGESATAPLPPPPPAKDQPPPPPPPGRFARLRAPAPSSPPPAPAPTEADQKESLLQRGVKELARLESGRTKRNNRFLPSAAHRRYLNASAGWRLRLAHEMDPGDAVLYEILHYHITSQHEAPAATRKLVTKLAEGAIRHGLSPRASMSDALTGAGAAINILNDQLLLRRSDMADDASIVQHWTHLSQCMARFREVRREADEEGWWQAIPPVRREEIDSHGVLLERISETIRKTLVEMKLIS